MTDSEEMTLGLIIPARYQSTRLPGKPLLDLCGKSMLQRTWENCVSAHFEEDVYVATDDERIASAVVDFGGRVIMTSPDCLTGTDRIAEANSRLMYDIVVNVQGDEPIISPHDIESIKAASRKTPGQVICGMAKIVIESEFWSSSIPKVVFSQTGRLLYMSRAPIPGNKTSEWESGFKQVCVYAFPRSALEFFLDNSSKSRFEMLEDIEILRLVEANWDVRMVELSGSNLAVDTPDDVKSVCNRILTSERL
jgi:3-deoxy-manno-octulosonate cytidylyltransferase (CMP-KDO synthetase)